MVNLPIVTGALSGLLLVLTMRQGYSIWSHRVCSALASDAAYPDRTVATSAPIPGALM
jgi:hypothetical protein